jgi:hypothetical protein
MTNNANVNNNQNSRWRNLAFLFLMTNASFLMTFFKKLFIEIHQIQAFCGAGKGSI